MSLPVTNFSLPGCSVEFEGKKFSFSSGREAAIAFLSVFGPNPVLFGEFMKVVSEKYPALVRHNGRPISNVSYGSVVSYLNLLRKRWLGKTPIADEKTARRRSAICSACEYNQDVAGCQTCQSMASLLLNVPDEEFSRNLGGCSKCGCYLKLKVWLAPKILKGDFRKIEYPQHCWMNDL